VDLSLRTRDVVRGFRLAEDAQAHSALVALIDALAPRLGDARLIQHNAAIMPILQQILDAQQRGDTLWIADLLEYELLPIFSAQQV
jgi:hypothetical protein